MNSNRRSRFQRSLRQLLSVVAAVSCVIRATEATAQDTPVASVDEGPNLAVLSTQRWQEIDTAVGRGLKFIADNQQADGSFTAPEQGQPGITSLGVMAFLSFGHVPGKGPYGDNLERAVEFVLSTQHSSGVLSVHPRGSADGGRANYNHAIAGVMLGEVYGMTTGDLSDGIRTAVPRALKFSRLRQTRKKTTSP